MTNTLNPWRYWQHGDCAWVIVREGWQLGCDALYEYRRNSGRKP